MTPAKKEALLQGQTSIARKIYECVPIQEAWPTHQIAQALKATAGATTDMRRVQACLSDLADAGLIREPQRRSFQRVEVKDKPKTPELKMPANQPLTTSTATPVEPKSNALDRIAGLAGELSDIADHLRQRLMRVTKIAKELEDVALAVEQERESSNESLAKLSQLKDLLKGL